MEMADLLRLGAALVLVVALMGLLSLVMRKFNAGNPLMPGNKRRLRVVEILPLGARHKAVLLRRDDKEHLVILGTNGECVIETGIESRQDIPEAKQ